MNDLTRSLQELPPLPPPPGGWTRLSAQLELRDRRRRRQTRWAGGLALAASVLLAVVLLRPVPDAPPARVAAADPLGGLMQQSQALELRLAALKSEAGVWDGALARSAAVRQRDVGLVDLQLSDVSLDPQADRRAAEVLWQQRVRLLSELVAAHEAPSLTRSTPAYATASEPAAEAEVLEL